MTTSNDPLLPSDTLPSIFQRALRNWWLVALGFILGGAAALGAGALRPPQYESRFEILNSIDFTISGELTQFEEDLAMEVVGVILGKPAMRERVAAAAQTEGIPVDGLWLRDHASVERRLGTWIVRVRAGNPAQAERLAEIWRGFGVEELIAARKHALIADGLRRRQQSLEECLSRAAAAEPSQGLCVPQNLTALQTQLAEAGALIAAERASAQGLSSALLFGEFPTRPQTAQKVLYGRAEQTAAGAGIGLILGIWAAQADWVEKLRRRKRG